MQLKNLGEFTTAINEFKLLGDMSKLSVNSANILSTSFKELTAAEILNKVATLDLTDAQKVELVQKCATDAQNYQNIASINALSASQAGATTSTLGLGSAMKGLWATLKSNPFILVATAVTAGITLWQNYKQSIEETISSAKDAANTYAEQSASIDEAVIKYQTLRTQLIAAKGNEEETYNIKQQLLALQTELNQQFGDEYGKLNLVTDAYKDQTEAIKALSKESANTFLNENRKGIDTATEEMTKDRHYILSSPGISLETPEGNSLKEIINSYSDEGMYLVDGTDGTTQIHLKADAENAYDTINSFENDVKEKAKELGNEHLFDGILDASSNALNDAKETVDEYGEIFNQAQIAEIASDDKLSNGYNEAVSAVEAYNEAVLNSEDPYNDKSVKKAWDNLQTLKQGIQENEEAWGQYSNIMANVFNSANDDVYSFYNALQNNESVSALAEDLRGLSAVELQAMADDWDNDDSLDKLYEKAKEYGLEVQDVINLLIELGIIQGQITNEATNAKTSLSFDTTTAIEKLKSLEDSMSSLDNCYTTLLEGGKVDLSSLNGISESFSELENADMTVVNDALDQIAKADSLEEAQTAMNALAMEYLNASDILDGLNQENSELIATELESMGIQNAKELVTARLAAQEAFLAAKKNNSAIASDTLSNATFTEISAILAEGNASAQTTSYLAQLALQKLDLSQTKIDSIDDVNQIIAIANAAGTSIEYIDGLRAALLSLVSASTKNYVADYGMDTGKDSKKTDAVNARIDAEEELNKFLENTGRNKLNAADFYPDYSGSTNTDSSTGNSGSSDSSQETTETFDFLQTKIENLQTSYDNLKNKASQTFSTMTTRTNAYSDAIEQNNLLIAAQQDAIKEYKGKRDAVGLDASWAEKVRNGSIDIAEVSDPVLKEKLQQYKEWNDKIVALRQSNKELRAEQKELARENIEVVIAKYDKLIAKSEAANDRISKKIDIKESLGFSAKASDYIKMNHNILKQIGYNDKQIAQLKKLQAEVDKGSQAWQEYQERIDSTNASTQDLTASMIENAQAAAALAAEKAEAKVEKLDSKDELTDAKIDNAATAARKNNLIDYKIDRIDSRQKAYDNAYQSSSDSLKKSGNTLLNKKKKNTNTKNKTTNKANKTYNNVLKKVQAQVLTMEKFNNTEAESAYKISSNDQKKTSINNQISLAEAEGEKVSTAYCEVL